VLMLSKLSAPLILFSLAAAVAGGWVGGGEASRTV
jgi:hypothetical protein